MYTVSTSVTFSAAHALRNYEGPCARVHGHDYRVEVEVEGERLDERGLLVDFHDLEAWLAPLLEQVDHRLLNEVPPFDAESPTAEALAAWFYRGLGERVQRETGGRVRLAAVHVWETPHARATYREAAPRSGS